MTITLTTFGTDKATRATPTPLYGHKSDTCGHCYGALIYCWANTRQKSHVSATHARGPISLLIRDDSPRTTEM